MSESTLNEEWRDIPGYEGEYQVSDMGRVRSLDRICCDGRFHPGKILTLQTNTKGYYIVDLGKENGSRNKQVHRLVLLAFVGPSSLGGCHKDHNPANNKLTNLMYGTQSTNLRQSVLAGRQSQARQVRRSDGKEFPSLGEAARQSGTWPSHILKVIRGERKHAGYFGWEYV